MIRLFDFSANGLLKLIEYRGDCLLKSVAYSPLAALFAFPRHILPAKTQRGDPSLPLSSSPTVGRTRDKFRGKRRKKSEVISS